MMVVSGIFSGEMPTAPCSSSQDGAATADGSSVLPVSLSLFVDTYVSAPPRIIAPRIDYGPQYRGIGECPF